MTPQPDPEQLARELAELREEHRRVLQSTSYRLGRLLLGAARSPRDLLRLPVDLYRLHRERRAHRQAPGPGNEQFDAVKAQLQTLSGRVRAKPGSGFVFLFSGTTYIQGTRGNRPIRQTQAMLRRGVPVLFSYHRSRSDEPLPAYAQDGLVQSPVDVTMQLLDEIALADLGEAPRLYIVSYPYPGIEKSVALFRRQGWKVIYDCRDDWEEFSKVGMARWFDAEVERVLVAQCDATFCVAGPLVNKMRALAPGSRVALMPNAVEEDFLPEGYQRQPQKERPIVGYFGHLAAAWFDWDAFADIARRRPQYDFEVIGHSAPQDLDLPENLQLLGPKPWDQLHEFARHWSAAVIPFRMGRLADGVDPIKIYEYLSFGLPVVSFRMPQIANYPYTTTVDSVEAFCSALDEACATEPDPARLADFLAQNTWEARARQLIELMESPAP